MYMFLNVTYINLRIFIIYITSKSWPSELYQLTYLINYKKINRKLICDKNLQLTAKRILKNRLKILGF